MLELLMGGSTGGGGTPSEPLLAGTYAKGWYGEVAAVDFITGDALASAIGLKAGTSVNSTSPWLKFSLDNKTLYVAKKPFRYGFAFGSAGSVIAGGITVTINSKTYKVRLLNGRGDNLTTAVASGYDTSATWNSEWNRLMYHVSGPPFVSASNSLASEGISVGDWAQYSDADLGFTVTGNSSFCQDKSNKGVVARGLNGVSYIYSVDRSDSGTNYGWRPCLELIG